MKKFEKILEEIKALYTEVKETEEKEEKEIDAYMETLDGLSLKDKVEKRKSEDGIEHTRRILEYQECIKNEKLKIKLLQNNAKIALFNEVMPIVLEVLQKYNGKSHGEKTSQKIREEIKEKTNCYVYISSQSFRIVPCDTNGNTYNVECGTRYIDGEKKPLLIDNKINLVTMEDLNVYYINRTYFEDLDGTIAELKRLHAEALKKQDELKEICSQFNRLSVEGITDLNYMGNINNII